ncbi:MAG: type IV pilus assembly protein PilM [Planctomycetaceae bacterium]
MADYEGVWGIDIGQAGLKAIRLKYAEAADQVLAVAFDYVPHPKILSQPDAIPEELIAQALQTFLSRNDVKGDRVAISVPGQTALTRFIQLPPVESSKVAEIVKYEARQQIPFALEEVCWQWQTLSGGVEESGYMLEAEVGLFAMKRDQVMQSLQPFIDHQIEVDLIQIAPLALYNFLSYDRLGVRKDDPPADSDEHTIILDMGADNTTLMVSNGAKIWIRNVPIGGNHFTRALTKEMKLTFAKAEHLKINATKSPDPRAVFQALRPVFNDYVSEIQRSIGYFSSVNRNAKIAKVIGIGNGFKLAGLQKFLQQNLQYDVERIDSFQALVGDSVLNAKLFEENILSFAVPYGLALQGLGLTRIHVDLLPEEIRTERIIRQKKPWAVAAAATLLCSLALSATGYARMNKSVSTKRFGEAEQVAKDVASKASADKTAYDAQVAKYKEQDEKDSQLVRPTHGKVQWAELHKAIIECLPRDPAGAFPPNAIDKKNRIKIWSFTAKELPDVSEWYKTIPSAQKPFMREEDRKNPPTGKGFIVTLEVAHYHKTNSGEEINYIERNFMDKLRQWSVDISHPQPQTGIPVRAIGITHPVIAQVNRVEDIRYILDRRKFQASRRLQGTGTDSLFNGNGATPGLNSTQPYTPPGTGAENYVPPGSGSDVSPGSSGAPMGSGVVPGFGPLRPTPDEKDDNILKVPLTRVTVQLVWQPVPLEKRILFNRLHEFFKANPKGDYAAAEQYLNGLKDKSQGLKLTQELFDEFTKKHYAKAAPQEETSE